MLVVALRVCFSIPSLLGASYIAQHVLRSAERRQRVFARIMFGMSSMDVIFAIYTIVSPLTRETTGMCRATGFFGQGARLSSVLYNGVLTLYYLLTIRYGWKERAFRQGFFVVYTNGWFNMEFLMHLAPLVLGWGSALLGLVFGLYHPTLLGCSIVRDYSKPWNEKILKLQQMSLFYAWVWLIFGFIIVSMTLIYVSIARVEKRAAMYRVDSTPRGRLGWNHNSSIDNVPMDDDKSGLGVSNSTSRLALWRRPSQFETVMYKRRRTFALQAFLYCFVFFLTWIWTTVQAYIVVLILKLDPLPQLIYMTAVFETLAGFWNALVYLRPRYAAYRRKQQQQQQQQHGNRRSPPQVQQRSTSGLDFSFRHRIEALRLAASISVDPEEEEMRDAPPGSSMKTPTPTSPAGSFNASANPMIDEASRLESQAAEEGDSCLASIDPEELST